MHTDNTRISPSKRELEEGNNVTFVCYSESKAVWYFENQNIPDNAKSLHTDTSNRNVLIISNITAEHNGFYECKGTYYELTFYATGELKVKSKFRIKETLAVNIHK